jgi:hypothetical protein
MNELMRQAMLAAAVVSLMAATAGRAPAETIVDFSYYGRGGPDEAGLISTGNGSFAFADGLSTLSLADLTSFDFTLSENTPNTAIFGLSDLTSFSASIGPGPTLTSLALATSSVQGSNPETYPREFDIASLSDMTTYADIYSFQYFLTSGTVTITSIVTTPVPEPSTFTLAVLGALIVASGWCRRRQAGAVFGRISVDHHDPARGRK